MKLLIISAGRYPIPAVNGGAVSTLIEHLANGNEKKKLFDLEIASPYDMKAYNKSKKYKNCKYIYIKTPRILNILEEFLYSFLTIIFPHENLTSIKSIFSFMWFVWINAINLKKNDYDYIMFENTARLYWSLKLFNNKEKYKNKVIYHLHNEPKKLGGCRNEILNSAKIICISNYIRNSITNSKSILNFKDRNKTFILNNCVDINLFKPFSKEIKLKIRKEFGIKEDENVIVFSGRIDKEKGIKELLNAISKVKTPRIKLLIAGSSFYGMNVKSSFEEEIINMVKTINNNIIFTGFVSYEDMPKVYNSADIAVLPSMWEEPAGLTIIESMACGIPVITTVSGRNTRIYR